MRGTAVVILALVASDTMRAEAAGRPSGCWAIRDAVERLACFDMALGPPVSQDPVRERPEVAPAAPKAPEAAPPVRKTTPD